MKKIFIVIAVVLPVLLSCKKFLDAKPDQKLAVPSTLRDLQSMLDYYDGMNAQYPFSSELLSDNYYLTSADWSALTTEYQRNYYLWQKDDNVNINWSVTYGKVYYANVILDNLAAISSSPSDSLTRNVIRGSALFFRSTYFYFLAQIYSPCYDKSSAASDLGLPLRITSDYVETSVRSSVQETYDKIINDLKEAAILLPVTTALKTRPNKTAVFGAIARTYLSMQDYTNAGKYADSCLQLYDSLMDFNTLNAAATAPISRFNKEVIFQGKSQNPSPLTPSRCKIDSNLYASYLVNDLRKTIYFKSNGNGTYAFKGDLDGSGSSSGYVFTGIVTDEMYLIRAECNARSGNITAALFDLNALLKKRFKTGFVPLTAATADDALLLILNERRKELLFRGARWTDLRRLNKESRFAVTPRRIINGQLYELISGSPRYTMLFPKIVIDLSGMPQNP